MTRQRLVSIFTALVLLGSGLSLYLALTRSDQVAQSERPGESTPYRAAALDGPAGPALDAAVQALPVVLSYDFRDLDASLAAATRTMTAAFAKDFAVTFDARARSIATSREAVADAVVQGAGVVRTQGDSRAVCLVYVDQRLLRSARLGADGDPRTLSRNRVLVDVVLRSGVWKIDGIHPF